MDLNEFYAATLTATLRQMVLGSGLAHLGGYPFEVRYSDGSLVRARAAAEITADAYIYFNRLFSVEPDIAVIVASDADWESRQPYGLPFFNDPVSSVVIRRYKLGTWSTGH
jgi:hypothetical protein